MASVDASTTVRNDWALSNPWTWMLASLWATGTALLWVRIFGEDGTPLRVTLALGGALAAAAALYLRIYARGGAFLDNLNPRHRSVALLGLTVANLALVAWAGGILIAAINRLDVPWGMGGIIALWVLVFPACTAMSFYTYNRHATGRPVSARAEAAILCLLAAASLFMACWSLYVDNLQAENLDTLRLLLAALALAAYIAVPLCALPARPRRLAISLLILFHFGGILSAVLSPAPSPWLSGEAYYRVYRPYLEFMYLTNAYHFYAPDPGPSYYITARVQYEKPNGEHYWHWWKFPDVDEQGHHHHPTNLEYQRHIAMTDNIRGLDAIPPPTIYNKDGQLITNPVYYWRFVNSNHAPEDTLGKRTPKAWNPIPLHPSSSPYNQYLPASKHMKLMTQSYARHIASLPHPDHPQDKAVLVKMYWVQHPVAPLGALPDAFEPGHPTTFYPYYHGMFDTHGVLLDEPKFDNDGFLVRKNRTEEIEGDPFLYWLLPVLPQDPFDKNTAVANWMYRHAGDKNWYRGQGEPAYRSPTPSEERALLGTEEARP